MKTCGGRLLLGVVLTMAGLGAYKNQEARADRRQVESNLLSAEKNAWEEAHPGFDKRHSAEAMVSTPQGAFGAWLGQASLTRRLGSDGRLPMVVSVSGCGVGHTKEGFPDSAVRQMPVLAFSEGRDPDGEWSELRLCSAGDGEGLSRSLEAGLEAVFDAARGEPWLDARRIILVGRGEGAPVVASWTGPVQSKILIGEPCLAPWGPIVRRPETRMDIFLGAGGGNGQATAGHPCAALPRPVFPREAAIHLEPDAHNGGVISLLKTRQFNAYKTILTELAASQD